MTVNVTLETEAQQFDDLFKRIAEAALRFCGTDMDAAVEVLITDDAGIQVINQEARGIDRPTDVLSFPMIEWSAPADKDVWRFLDLSLETNPETGNVFLGDIVISMDTAGRQAEEYGHSLTREVSFLFLHGMLHLLGYDHVNEEQESAMRSAQRSILDGLGITRGNDHG